MAELKNTRHERFARGIVAGLKISAAYTAAGYAARTEGSIAASASKLLTNPKVASRVDELKRETTKVTVLTIAMVIEGLLEIARDQEAPHSARRAAWRDLGEHLAMFKMRHEHTLSMNDRVEAVMETTGISREEAERAVEEAARAVSARN